MVGTARSAPLPTLRCSIVVPANAGTHTPRLLVLRQLPDGSSRDNKRLWLRVPAQGRDDGDLTALPGFVIEHPYGPRFRCRNCTASAIDCVRTAASNPIE